jgi:hypothetical protein
MSKSAAALRTPEQMSASNDQPAAKKAAAPKAVAPFKPHRKLAISLLVLFIVWIALLYVMYFATVYHHAVR